MPYTKGKLFRLFPKGEIVKSATRAVIPAIVDKEICDFLKLQYHPNYFVANWFEVIGTEIIGGKPIGSLALRAAVKLAALQAQQQNCKDEAVYLRKIIDYLEERYTSEVVEGKDD